ncbi:MAG: hypothetical protein KKG60_03970 [Nanoarchaeota archaeon]|nr:hypothetical protein [Nanoarchaeota archaeon]
MRMIKHKKGAELSMNVIIIAILAILVLVIVAAFFTGGMARLMELISGTRPDSISTATSMCQSDCDVASIRGTPQEKTNSKYCRQTFRLDNDEDGKIDTTPDGSPRYYHCWESPISIICGGVKEFCAAD